MLVFALLASLAGCGAKDDAEYTQIVDATQTYSFAMSRSGGLSLIPIINDLESLTFSCDKGELFYYSGMLPEGVKKLDLGSKQITYGDSIFGTAYWYPEFEDEENYTLEDVIEISAQLSDGTKYYQKLYVSSDGLNFTLTDSKKK
jgi:hypothetical protein